MSQLGTAFALRNALVRLMWRIQRFVMYCLHSWRSQTYCYLVCAFGRYSAILSFLLTFRNPPHYETS